jgi:hypothetical protein
MPLWPNLALGGMGGVIDRTIYTAGKVISGIMMDLVTDLAKLRRCQEEFRDRTSPKSPSYWEPPLIRSLLSVSASGMPSFDHPLSP